MILGAPSMAVSGRCCPGKTGVLEVKKDFRTVLTEKLYGPWQKRRMDSTVAREAEAERILVSTTRG